MIKTRALLSLISIVGIVALSLAPLDAVAKKKKKETFRPNWMEWGAQNYPAKVIRITSQYSIDTQNHICYGKWCVGFPNKNSYEKDYPIALYTSDSSNNSYRVIVINPLLCTNDIMGELPCYMELYWNRSSSYNSGYKCSVQVGKTYAEEGNTVSSFEISCPNIFFQ